MSDGSIALVGVEHDLTFNAQGYFPDNGTVDCVSKAANGTVSIASAGQTFDVASNTLQGTFACP
jgi:hypothetical protein